MAQINMDLILAKAKKRMKDSDMQKRIEKTVDNLVLNISPPPGVSTPSPTKAARKFIEVLQSEIKSHAGIEASEGGLGSTAIDVLSKLEFGEPIKVGKYRYQIGVRFSEDLHRESLVPDYFASGIDNIAALLNKGYATKNTVYGIWLNHWPWNIPSLTHRESANFIEEALRVYMANYATQYGVINIEVDDIYK